MFTATYLENNKNYEDAIKIYPYLTDSQLVVLRQTEDVNIAKETAESVIKRNKYSPLHMMLLQQSANIPVILIKLLNIKLCLLMQQNLN